MIVLGLIGLGLILGSFVNALIWRLREQSKYFDDEGKPKKLSKNEQNRLHELSIAKGRSMCSKCGHQLSALDLVPFFSWLFLRGRCRYCQEKIEDTPLLEIGLPFLLVLTYAFWPYSFESGLDFVLYGVWTLIMTCFVALAAYDFKWYLLPDRIVVPLTVLATIFVLLLTYLKGDWTDTYQAILGAIVFSGIFLAMYVVSKGTWIGFGDVKLAVTLGLIVGSPVLALLAIFTASLSGTLVALPQLLSSRNLSKKTIPFGPHLLLATVIVFLFGKAIVDWYLDLLAA